jgi:Flp pilus assembly protein TadG
LIVLGIVDFGFLFQRLEVVTNAAREGARIAVLPSYDTADVEERIENYLTAAGVAWSPSTLDVSVDDDTITLTSGATITGKRVGVTYQSGFLFLGPIASWFGGSLGTVPLSASATMRSEGG